MKLHGYTLRKSEIYQIIEFLYVIQNLLVIEIEDIEDAIRISIE